MKKFLTIFLPILLLCALIPFAPLSVSAAETPTIVVSTVEEADAGDEIKVEVSLMNNPGVISAVVKIEYDESVMELVPYYDEDEDEEYNVESASGWSASKCYYGPEGTCLMGFTNGTAKKNVTKELFYTATFKIKDDAASGTYPLTVVYNPNNFFNLDGDLVTFDSQDATIVISGSEHEHTCSASPLTKKSGQAPTCAAFGWKDYYQCTDATCGKLYANADATGEITDLDAWKLTGAGYIAPTANHADKENDGDHKCDTCTHIFTNACSGGTATCTAKAICSECGQSYGGLGNHAYGELIKATEAVHTQTELKGAVAAHYFCDVCDKYFTDAKVETTLEALIGEAPQHAAQADDGDCTTDILCSCGKVMVKGNAKHTGGTATCVAKAKCSECGTEYGEVDPTKHAYGKSVTNWHQIGDDWYYGEYRVCGNNAAHVDHTPVTGLKRVTYPKVAINGVTYAPNAEDLAYYNAHKSSSKYSDAETAEFYFDKDGKFLADFTGIVGDSYVVNGIAPWHVGFVEVDGEYYYFGGDKVNGGNVMLTGKVYTSRANGTGKVDGIYNFDVDGKLIGNYYGLYEYNGDIYYRRTSTGELATGWYYITVTNGIEGFNKGDKLFFDEDGKMADPKNGIVEEGGKLYYYVNNSIKGAGLIEIDGDYYYVRTSTGEVVTGEYYITVTNGIEGFSAGQKCVFGTDGKLIK